MSYCFKTCSKHQTKFHLSVSALQPIIIKTIIYMLLHINTRENDHVGKVKSAFKCVFQLVKGAPDPQLRSLHIQKDPTAYTYIKVGGQIKVLHHVQI